MEKRKFVKFLFQEAQATMYAKQLEGVGGTDVLVIESKDFETGMRVWSVCWNE